MCLIIRLRKMLNLVLCNASPVFPLRSTLQGLCAFLAGVRHLFGLSAFMWMLNEAVLLFVFVKNLASVSSNREEGLSWKWLMVIGYLIPLAVVGVSAAVFPHGYVNDM